MKKSASAAQSTQVIARIEPSRRYGASPPTQVALAEAARASYHARLTEFRRRSKDPAMNLDAIPVGPNAPWDVNVVIEIPQGGLPVKYEMDKESGALFVDRFLHTAMYYPGNYGFIPHTLSDDGDPCDVIVLNPTPVVPGCVIRSRPIGVLMMVDEAGGDEKILAVPVDKLNPYYTDVASYRQLPAILIEQIEHFFTHYKDLEKGKSVTVKGWGDAGEAAEMIAKGMQAHQDKLAAKKAGKAA
jgi:inorganic pyrophosphatase